MGRKGRRKGEIDFPSDGEQEEDSKLAANKEKGGKKGGAGDSVSEQNGAAYSDDEQSGKQMAKKAGKKDKKGKKKAPKAGFDSDDEGGASASVGKATSLKVAQVTSVSPHPNADKLRLCTVDFGQEDEVQVVTNAVSVKAGMMVALAPVGCTTPGSGIQIKQASVRGVSSEGMLCSAYDIGWVSKADGVLVQLPSSCQVGDDVPMDPPKGAIYGPAAGDDEQDEHEAPPVSKKDKKDRKKKKGGAAGFAALDMDEADEPMKEEDEEESEVAPPARKGSKSKKSKKGGGSVFAALGVDDGVTDDEEEGEGDEEQEGHLPARYGKKGGAKSGSSAFAALGMDDDDDEEEEEEEEEVVTAVVKKNSKKEKKKEKKKGGMSAFAALGMGDDEEEEEEENCMEEEAEQEVAVIAKKDSKKDKKKKKQGGGSVFAALELGDDDEEGADVEEDGAVGRGLASGFDALGLDEEGEEEEAAPVSVAQSKKDKKKKQKKSVSSSAFAALGLDDNESQPDEEEPELPAKGTKAKTKKPVASSAFAALGLDDGDEELEEEEATVSVPALEKKKDKKKKKSTAGSAFAALGLDEDEEDGTVEQDEGNVVVSKGKKKGKADVSSAFAALGLDDDEDGVDEGADEEATEVLNLGKKKGKKKKSGANADALFEALAGASEEAQEQHHTAALVGLALESASSKGNKKSKGKAEEEGLDAILAELDIAAEQPAKADKKKKKKKGKQDNKEEEDLDALLAQFGAAAPPEAKEPAAEAAGADAEQAGGSKKDKKKKKKGKDKEEKVEEDIDALLAELGEAPPAASASTSAAQEPAESAAADAAAAEEGGEEGDEEGDKHLSAAAKKKAKKKAKEKAKKAAAKEGGEVEEEEPMKAEPAGKKGAKVPAARKKMLEEIERRRKAEEEARLAEEERKRKEEEEIRRLEEEERRKKEEAERKKEEKKKKKEEMRAAGLLKTAKQKEEERRLAAIRERLLQQAKESGVGLPDEAPKKKKVVYEVRKRQPKKQQEEQPIAQEVTVEVPPPKEDEVTPPAAPPEPTPVPEAHPEAPPEPVAADDDEDDWDVDVDTIEIPGLPATASSTDLAKEEPVAAAKEAAKEVAPAKAAEPATKAAAKEPAAEAKLEEEPEAKESEEESEEEESEEESSEEETSSEEESESESESESEVDSEEEREELLRRAKEKRFYKVKKAMATRDPNDFRSPICCILGHVDTGKTKILDNIRRTNVQEGEAGGITQQIGATYIPADAVKQRTKDLRKGEELDLKLPGLLVIDTPGHESFTNLRTRGSGLCDIAILVIDLMHGLEPQTIESIGLLKMRKTPFVVALNKIDRLFDWKTIPNAPFMDTYNQQKQYVHTEFRQRFDQVKLQLNEQGLNVSLYWENPDPRKYVNIVPTSAITGEGIPDLLNLLVELTQRMMGDKLLYLNELQCTVLEVKVIEGLGTTIDVVLVNGTLREGDNVILCGINGPIMTTIRSLLTPQPLKELRIKGSYIHHKELKAAQGVKIAAQHLENAVAGTQMFRVEADDVVDELKQEVMEDMQDIFSSVDRTAEGVCVQASTLGSLEALLEFLRSPDVKIPVCSVNLGPIHKRDVMRAGLAIERGLRKFAVLLAFDVPVTREAQEQADEMGVRIFTADIIYHLFDQFTAYLKQCKEEEVKSALQRVAFPCVLKILPTCIFNKKDPIVLGVEVVEGIARVGTPLCIPSQNFIDLGKISSIELNHKAVDMAKRGDSVAMKIEATNTAESTKLYGRHFDHKDELVSRMTRTSIDLLKQNFRDELTRDDWRLVVKLKSMFQIA